MKITYLLFIFFSMLSFSSLIAQDTTKVTYYKNLNSNPINNSAKAKFVKYEISEGLVETIIIISLLDNNIITSKSYQGEASVGVWIRGYYSNYSYKQQMLNYNFNLESFKEENPDIFYQVDTVNLLKDDLFLMPKANGEEQGLQMFIARNIIYPSEALENNVQGKVLMHFVVELDGTISNVETYRGVDPLLDNAVIKLVNSLPKFTPGELNGKKIKVGMIIPINFKIG